MSFYQTVRERLKIRQAGFDFIFNYLSKIQNPLIVETGSSRLPDNFENDGQSSILFDRYVLENGGNFFTVDNSEKSYKFCAESFICDKSKVTLSDSVSYLKSLSDHLLSNSQQIDVLYLDSQDALQTDQEITKQSALHHLYELIAILPSLKKGCLICVDDNWIEIGHRVLPDNINQKLGQNTFTFLGKGKYIEQYMRLVGKEPCHIGFQMIWSY
jgi:hypothetical protein